MRLIVGLGNPGDKYRSNRHNIGFMAADSIAARHGFSPWRQKFRGLLAEGSIGGEKVLLLKPQTFMNSSGDSVGAAVNFHKLDPADVIVIYDELDLVPGKVRVKVGGGNGGHNGLRSIDPQIGTGYKRVRLGIGHPGSKDAVIHYVLNDFAKADAAWLNPLLDAVADNAGLLVEGDDNTFMNRLAIAVQGDGAQRPERPGKSGAPVDPFRPKAQSHVRAARPKPPQARVPETGPMAAMLKRLLGDKGD
jgi:PTH1 family peptidyl-tRNA hydrolase